MTTDWRRIACPQPDGYDSAFIHNRAVERYAFAKCVPGADETTWLDGGVLLKNDAELPGPGIVAAPLNHPSLQAAELYLKAWPECYWQAQRLLQVVFAFNWSSAGPGARGCICGTGPGRPGKQGEDAADFGSVFSTVFDPVGFLEGVVHEMAHWKLHALGIHFEAWDNELLLNTPDELFVSSVRKDKKRPMGAVLHAHWVYLHVLASNLAAWSCRPFDRQADLTNIQYNVGRAKEGQTEIAAHARWTDAGRAFWDGVQEWTDTLLATAGGLSA